MGVVLLTANICPNVGEDRFVFGLPSSEWLNTLKASMRTERLVFSVILIVLAIAVSIWNRCGPRAMFRPALPQIPLAGIEKAAGFIHSLMVWPPGGISDTPGTRSGRWLALLPSSMSVVLRETVTFKGSPLRIEATPLTVQLRSSTKRADGRLRGRPLARGVPCG